MEILKPYRAKIDALDQQIIKLLRERYDVIEEVGELKAAHGIAATLPDRVEEVRENAARLAGSLGLDEAFIREIYAQIIAHSCETEEQIITQSQNRKVS